MCRAGPNSVQQPRRFRFQHQLCGCFGSRVRFSPQNVQTSSAIHPASKFNWLLRHLPQYCTISCCISRIAQSTRFSTACTSFTLVSSSSPTLRAAMVQVPLPIQAYRVEPVALSCPDVTIQTATRGPPRNYVSGSRESSNTFDFCSRIRKKGNDVEWFDKLRTHS